MLPELKVITYTRVLVSMTKKNSNVVLEDLDDVAVVVELTAVARIGASPPAEVDLKVRTGLRQVGSERESGSPDKVVFASVVLPRNKSQHATNFRRGGAERGSQYA